MGNITTFVNRMKYWCNSVSLGYDQTNRWNIRPGGECDCSSLVIYAAREAGFQTGLASYTGNMSSEFTKYGWVRLSPNVTKQPGDILLNDVHHVAVYIGNNQLAQASISERGSVSGAAGDQTGRETNISTYYNYPWNCVLRYVGEEDDMALSDNDINRIANAIWNFNQNGTLMRDRMQGTDAAANGANKEIHRLSKWDDKTHASNMGNLVIEQPITYNGSTQKLGNRLAYIDMHTHVMDAKLEALTAAVEALSKNMGADPEAIAAAVKEAVQAKLDALEINVTVE